MTHYSSDNIENKILDKKDRMSQKNVCLKHNFFIKYDSIIMRPIQ